MFTSKIFGNTLENEWNDNIVNESSPIVAVRKLRVSQMTLAIPSLQVTYEREDGSLYDAPKRGDPTSFRLLIDVNLAEDDCIIQVEGTTDSQSGNLVSFTLITTRITTNGSVIYGPYPYGTGGDTPFTFEGHVLGFYGTENSNGLTGIGFIYQPPGPFDFTTEETSTLSTAGTTSGATLSTAGATSGG